MTHYRTGLIIGVRIILMAIVTVVTVMAIVAGVTCDDELSDADEGDTIG